MHKVLQHHEQQTRVGKCDCGGTIILFRQELTVEAGGWPVTRVDYDCFCTKCGDGFTLTEKPAKESA